MSSMLRVQPLVFDSLAQETVMRVGRGWAGGILMIAESDKKQNIYKKSGKM